MTATFHFTYKNEARTLQTVGVFQGRSDKDPITFCCRYDWSRDMVLVKVGDTVVIDGTHYRVMKFEVDLTGLATFTLGEFLT